MKSLLVTLPAVTLATSTLAQNDDLRIRKPGKFGVSVKAGPAFPVGGGNDISTRAIRYISALVGLSYTFQ